MSIRPFARILREQGFVLDWRYRATKYNPSIRQFKKRVGKRELHVQLWGKDGHRVSHGEYNKYGLHETTAPTDFYTIGEMKLAILYEWVRPSTPSKIR